VGESGEAIPVLLDIFSANWEFKTQIWLATRLRLLFR
jgi:hypothetical protein